MFTIYNRGQKMAASDWPYMGSCRPEMAKPRLVKALFFLFLAGMTLLVPRTGLWAASSPASCPVNYSVQSISLTDWEAGLGSWTVDTYGEAQPLAFDTPDWAAVDVLPDGRTGTAAFVANLDVGACPGDDQSGVLTLTSPTITIPLDTAELRIAFNHWFDIEFGWDGGNLKISVNGGPFTLVPGSAFESGPYTDVLLEAVRDFLPYNLNPLADQEAFTGPGLQLDGARWQTSRLDLTGIAAAGDSVRLRFDLGIDECEGEVGWYIDEVEVYACEEDAAPTTPSLTLVNQVISDNGGTAAAEAWTLTATGSTGFSGPGPSVSSGINFQAGTYELSASGGPTGYLASEWSCTGGTQNDQDTVTVSENENVTCIITHDDVAPMLRLQKTIVNDDGGTVIDPDAFRLKIDGKTVLNDRFYVLDAGMHQASEQGLAGYAATPWGGDCALDGTITLAPGQNATCTLINDDIAPVLRLVKTIVNNDDGTVTDPDAFGLRIDGELVLNNVFYELEAGDHRVSEDGLPGYRPGWWSGDCASDGSITVSVGQEATCTITNNDEGPNIPINPGLAGGWFNPVTSGQGILLDVEPENQFIFAAWFTFTSSDSDQPFQQRWLTAQGNYSGESANLTLYETLGGKFDDPQAVSTLPVGEITLTFSDCSTGTMTYQIDTEGLQGEIPLTRLLPGTEALCQQETGSELQSVDINVGMNGGWFDTNTAGQGFLLDVLSDPVDGNFLFLAWFTFGDDTTSGQRWLTAQGGFEGASASILVYETTNGSFNDSREVTTVPVGQMVLDFSSCSEGIIGYDLPDEELEGEIVVTRLLPAGAALCEEIVGVK